MIDFLFITNSVLLGLGLAMDAFSVSVANGLKEPCMKKGKGILIATVFGFFQTVMPLIGWFLVHTVAEQFKAFEPFIPWIALALLGFIGAKMIIESVKNKDEKCDCCGKITICALLVQGVATSIDALSVGFTIAGHSFTNALISVGIIGVVTFALCIVGVLVGRKVGSKISNVATIIGGVILILIGLEIFITSFI